MGGMGKVVWRREGGLVARLRSVPSWGLWWRNGGEKRGGGGGGRGGMKEGWMVVVAYLLVGGCFVVVLELLKRVYLEVFCYVEK